MTSNTLKFITRSAIALLIVLMAMTACTPAGVKNVGPAEAKALLEGGHDKVFLLDVRTRGEYDQGHIEGAWLIPIDDLSVRLAELTPHKDKQIVVYCAVGGRSSKATNLLIGKGFSNVVNVSGGIQAWQQARYPVVR